LFRTLMVERVAYKEMFLTGLPPVRESGAGAEIAALAVEMEAIVNGAGGLRQLGGAEGAERRP
jgi:hypothetical protein